MAGKNQVTLTFVGDSDKLDRTLGNVGKSTRDMGRSADESSDRIDRLGEAGGTTETRFLGLGAGISGVSALMSGDLSAEDAAMAFADLGDSIEHTIAPMLKHAAHWAVMGLQATINGAKMAAAWLMGLGPMGIVIAIIGVVIGILVALGVGFDDIGRIAGVVWGAIRDGAAAAGGWIKDRFNDVVGFFGGLPGRIGGFFSSAWTRVKDGASGAKNWIVDRFNDVVGFFGGLPGRIGDAFSGVGRTITGGIKSVWNRTIGGFGFTVPSWIPGVGGRDFRIPKLHQGGIVPGAPGTETLALLQAGERVTRAGAAGGPTVVVNVAGSIRSDRDIVKLVRDELVRGGFR